VKPPPAPVRNTNSKKKKTKSPHIREVQQSGIGIICPAETPEGEGCGIKKNLAVTAYISLDRNDAIIYAQIEPHITPTNTVENTSKLMFNGIFQGWCAGVRLRDYLIELRRQSRLPFDTLIKLDFDDYLYVYTDGARPCRPLLIVDVDGKTNPIL
jgi:DNA-directed RNA polymerase beta subunit